MFVPILLSLLLFYWQHFEHAHFGSLSLPNIKQVLIGREEDMEVIVTYLEDSEVDLVTLFGSAGFGKSELALHVGHEMLNKGVDVHYIKVEEFTSVDSLEEELMKISGASYENKGLVRWAKGLHRRTLLILDNVDGSYWVQDNQRRKFQTSFLDVLQSQSTQLKILITSQQEIRSKSRFRSHRLLSLSTQGCVQLITSLADGVDMSSADCKKVCSQVGNVPKAIQVLVSILLPPIEYPIHYVIDKLNDTANKLNFVASTAEKVDTDRLLNAFALAFEFMEEQYQVCSVLLARIPGSFYLDGAQSILTPDLMIDFSEKFDVRDCLSELSRKSFLEKRLFQKWEKIENRYHFHVLIRNFLLVNATEKLLPKAHDTLDAFWRKYLPLLKWPLKTGFTSEDIRLFTEILNKNNTVSYNFAVSLLELHYYGSIEVEDIMLINQARDVLISNCGIAHQVTDTALEIELYATYICRSSQDCMEELALCQPKIEQLYFSARDDYRVRHSRYSFYSKLDIKCFEIGSTHKVCSNLWRNHLFVVFFEVTDLQKFHDQVNFPSTFLGIQYYVLMEDDKAIHHLKSALRERAEYSDGMEVHDTIVNIALYVIYDRHGDAEGMEASISNILKMDFHHINAEYLGIYENIIIPFLETVCGIKVYPRAYLVDDYYYIDIKCEHPLLASLLCTPYCSVIKEPVCKEGYGHHGHW